MLKKHISLLLSLIMILSVFMILPTAASSAVSDDLSSTGASEDLADTGYTIPTETAYAARLVTLKEKYYPSGYSGAYYEDGYAMAWQCYGYAVQMLYDVFGAKFYADGMVNRIDYTMGTLYAGDVVRIRSDTHSIFITRVTADGYYFTDANWDYNNGVRWDAYYSKAEMASTFTYKIHVPGNTLQGNGNVSLTALYVDTPVLKSAAADANGITVEWDAVDDASAYRIYYKGGDQKSWKTVGKTTDTSYQFTKSLVYDTAYTFTVRCLDAYGELISGYDKTGVSAVYSVASPKLTAAKAAVGKTNLTWDAVPSVNYYRVYAKATVNDTKWHYLANVKGTSYSYTGGKANTTYKYTIRCLNDSKELASGCSNILTAKFKTYATQLAAPGGIAAAPTNKQGAVKITWNAVSGATRYMVFVSREGVGSGWKKLGVTTATSYTYSGGLANDTIKCFTVRCVDSSNAFISDYDKTGAVLHYYRYPENQKVTKKDDNGNVKISWSAVSGADAYALYYKTASTGGWKRVTTAKPITGTTYTFGGCQNGVKYTFTVRACNSEGKLISSFNSAGVSITYQLSAAELAAVSLQSDTVEELTKASAEVPTEAETLFLDTEAADPVAEDIILIFNKRL